MTHAQLDELELLWSRLPQPELGQAIAFLRQACGDQYGRDLSRDALAARLCAISEREVGIDGTSVWRWEAVAMLPAQTAGDSWPRVCMAELDLMHPVSRRELLRQLAALAGVTAAGVDPQPWGKAAARAEPTR